MRTTAGIHGPQTFAGLYQPPADVLCYAALCRAWVALVGPEVAQAKMSVCIGSTSARACNTAGLTKVLYPDAPSIETWVDCVLQALQKQPVSAV
jgi:uroporphyrinogen-III synthase